MFDQLLNAFIVLFVVIDPIGLVPLFVGLTRGASEQYRHAQAWKGTGLASLILLMFVFTGDDLLRVLGIGLPAFKLAGGALLFLLAVDMVFARQSGMRSTTQQERAEAERKEDISVFPLAFPLIAGPGALTTILLMVAGTRGQLLGFLGLLVVLLMVLCMTLLALLFAGRIMRLLGETGANVISRVLGLILAAMAAQFIIDGVRASFFRA